MSVSISKKHRQAKKRRAAREGRLRPSPKGKRERPTGFSRLGAFARSFLAKLAFLRAMNGSMDVADPQDVPGAGAKACAHQPSKSRRKARRREVRTAKRRARN